MSAIVVENVSKRYIIGHQAQADTLRDALGGGVRSLWNRLRRQRQTREEFYALRDVSFKVEPGEVVGIIGRNGAGKSTLLKILSRITEPTTGRITLNGRVASLLEVGTGFHPELSGRENIFLNGAILGMSRVEIRKKFDEIVAFAEVEKFLDTPVKRYSSGMYVRLAFAVAAHLEPEILIVDEVLAVGDIQFQKKCLQRMQDVAHGGRTVLFVSHAMSAIRGLCPVCLYLKDGHTEGYGPTNTILPYYLQVPNAPNWIRTTPPASHLYIETASVDASSNDGYVYIHLVLRSLSAVKFSTQIRLKDTTGTPAAFAISGSLDFHELPAGTHGTRWKLDCSALAVGSYIVSVRLTIPGRETFDNANDILSFDFVAPPPAGVARRIEQSWKLGHTMIPLSQYSENDGGTRS